MTHLLFENTPGDVENTFIFNVGQRPLSGQPKRKT